MARRFEVTIDGFMRPLPDDIGEMTSPVRCSHCGDVYDLGVVKVTSRYTDCSVWQSPCCNRTVDDRGETGWKSISDYTRVSRKVWHE